MDAPSGSELATKVVRLPISNEELDRQLAGLTPEGRGAFKGLRHEDAESRLAEPSVDTRAAPLAPWSN